MTELAMLPGTYKWCVFEMEKGQTQHALINVWGEKIAPTKPEKCWNLMYSIEFNPDDEEEAQLAFLGCGAWIENNKAPGSKYVMQELFFYEIR